MEYGVESAWNAGLSFRASEARPGIQTASRRKPGTILCPGSWFSSGTLDSCFRRNDYNKSFCERPSNE